MASELTDAELDEISDRTLSRKVAYAIRELKERRERERALRDRGEQMSDEKRLRELAEAATPGPWRECASEILIGDHWWRPLAHAHYRNEDNAAYIAALSPDVTLALLDRIASLSKEVERLRGERDDHDRALGQLIDERDKRESQLDDIADALGDEGDWTNLHDRGDAALELAVAITAETTRLKQALGEAELTADELEALVHTIDDVSRMSTLDDDGGPKTEAVRVTAIATLRRLTGITTKEHGHNGE